MNMIDAAIELGYIKGAEDVFIDIDNIKITVMINWLL